MRKIILIILVSAFIMLSTSEAYSQFSNITVSGGLTTLRILGDNANTAPILQRDTSKKQIIGGSFNGTNPGFGLKANFGLDKGGKFNIPLGFEYIFFWTAQRIPISRKTTAYLKHTADMPVVTLGFDYKFYRLPFANVKLYAGAEFRGSFIMQGDYNRQIEYAEFDSIVVYDNKTKNSTFRGGLGFKLGLDGQVIDKFWLNLNFSWTYLNMIGKDDSRGELLTPTKLFESKESEVVTFNFQFLLQYRF